MYKYIVYYHDEEGNEHKAIHATKTPLIEGETYKIQIGTLGVFYIDKWMPTTEDNTNNLLIF